MCYLSLQRLIAALRQGWGYWLSPVVLCLVAGCSTATVQSGQPLEAAHRWVLLPVQNYAQTPQAGERMEAILATLVRGRGVNNLVIYPTVAAADGMPVLDERERYAKSLAWARQQGFDYALTGSVEEWRYKSGVEGEPAVGTSVQVVEVATGQVLWSACGARSGWGRETVSGTAQKLLKDLLANLPVAKASVQS
jgi:hypothetical protein